MRTAWLLESADRCKNPSLALADAASQQSGVLVAPSLNFGASPYFLSYPGTLSLRVNTLLDLVEDLVRSAYGKMSSLRDFVRDIFQIWVNEKPNQLAAALAYFGMFSFAPVIYIAYWLAGIFIDEAAAGERLYTRIEAVLGAETAAFIQESVSKITTADAGGSLIISIVSFITLLLAAMGLFLQLTYVLNRIWGVPLIQTKKKVAIIRQRLFAFVMVIALGLLVIVATVVNVVFAWFGSIIKDVFGGSSLLSMLNVLALLGIIILANAFTYKVLPDVKLAWRDVWPGSVAATLLSFSCFTLPHLLHWTRRISSWRQMQSGPQERSRTCLILWS